ncbi:hypothetical protein BK131_04660 [Paenibacillus amylolyticus]|uniref:Uncharacterized protein n=1 Tax=Paenibacillus amylolyticus TaxID=1451 RepID=A0A1R1C584_PAEAM|nr:hypothetical protein [Paenibacillus amylolyticus]OMF17260.1 hypothetical protein BK131_04660 [Paenibacillus amylolyticus]
MNWLESLEGVLPLAEKYGLALVMFFICIFLIAYVIRLILKGELVTREVYEAVCAERDEAQAEVRKITDYMNQERVTFMQPLLNMVNNLKKDSGEDRGG